ncbi:MAG: hypothetical protein ACI83D_000781, partial [Planctomycetota bacterium]
NLLTASVYYAWASAKPKYGVAMLLFVLPNRKGCRYFMWARRSQHAYRRGGFVSKPNTSPLFFVDMANFFVATIFSTVIVEDYDSFEKIYAP